MVMEEETDVRIKSLRPPLREKNAYKVFLQLWSVKKEICKKKIKVRNVLPLFIPVTPLPHFDLVFCGDSSKSDRAVCIHSRLFVSSNGEIQHRFVCEGTTLYLEGRV